VTIFGSARVPEDHWVYAAVRDVAEELTRLGATLLQEADRADGGR
jgi:predicted Rossmann-fold nucleotide-binding protein